MSEESEQIWNSEWISSTELQTSVDAKKIFDQQALEQLDAIIPVEEVVLFVAKAVYES